MAYSGAIFKRCGCRDPRSRRLLEVAYPGLAVRGHGSWYYHCSRDHPVRPAGSGTAGRVRHPG
jgi:hypothetical protein